MLRKLEMEKCNYLAFVPALLIMVMIFCFSSQSAVDSSQLSGGIIENVVGYMEESLSLEMDMGKRHIWLERGETLIRKSAHMSEYFLLAIAVSFGFYMNVKTREKYLGLSEMVCVIYAVSDEFHQIFIPGRSGQISDVLIDGMGALMGCLVFLWIERRVEKN